MTKFEKIKAKTVGRYETQIKQYEETLTEWKNKTLEEFIADRIYVNGSYYILRLSDDALPNTIAMHNYDKLVEIGKIYFSQEEEKED